MKTIRAKQAKVHSAYFVQRDQHGIIAKDLTCDVFIAVAVVASLVAHVTVVYVTVVHVTMVYVTVVHSRIVNVPLVHVTAVQSSKPCSS